MYQALYRKYRPLTFDEVYGQDVIVKTLKNSILNNRLNHAYLFTGPRGTGKTSVAKILGKTINCEQLNGIEPCNKCVNCTQINLKQSVDIIEIDAASNNGVEEIRELKSKINLVPSIGKYKVYIIDEVHMMTTSAFNALLKTLEEPPAHVVFVLATTEPHKIPATILSRCQRFDFKKIGINKIVERLDYIASNEKIEIDENALKEIARLSDGGMRDAISMFDQVLSFADNNITTNDIHEINGTITQQEIKVFVDALLEGNIEYLLNLIDNYNESGKNFVKLAEEIIYYLKNVLLYMTVPNYFKNNKINIKEYEDSTTKMNEDKLLVVIKEFNKLILDIKNTNNPKLMLELIIINLVNNNHGVKNSETIKGKETFFDSKKTENEQKNKKEPVIKLKEKPNIEENIIKTKKSEKEADQSTIECAKENINDRVIDESLKLQLEKVKEVRINNALANFDKKQLLKFQKELDLLRGLILDPNYCQMVSIILDGKLKALGGNNLIFVYDNEKLSNYFNENIMNIEKIFRKTYKIDYKVISTHAKEWEKIKKVFNSKLKEFKYVEESKEIESILKSTKKDNKDDLKKIFGDIIEYK